MRLSKLLIPAAFAAMVFPATSNALLITVTGGSWSLGSGWGAACTSSACDGEGDINGKDKVTGNHTLLNMDWTIDGALLSQSFSLNDLGVPVSINFGAGRFSDEDNKLDPDETYSLGIAGILNLSVQSGVNNAGTVTTATGSLDDVAADLSITFVPVTVDLGTGNAAFTIDLSDPSWNCNNGHDGRCDYPNFVTKNITATFTLTRLPDQGPPDQSPLVPLASPVPEPTTLALLGLGLAGLGWSRKR